MLCSSCCTTDLYYNKLYYRSQFLCLIYVYWKSRVIVRLWAWLLKVVIKSFSRLSSMRSRCFIGSRVGQGGKGRGTRILSCYNDVIYSSITLNPINNLFFSVNIFLRCYTTHLYKLQLSRYSQGYLLCFWLMDIPPIPPYMRRCGYTIGDTFEHLDVL